MNKRSFEHEEQSDQALKSSFLRYFVFVGEDVYRYTFCLQMILLIGWVVAKR